MELKVGDIIDDAVYTTEVMHLTRADNELALRVLEVHNPDLSQFEVGETVITHLTMVEDLFTAGHLELRATTDDLEAVWS